MSCEIAEEAAREIKTSPLAGIAAVQAICMAIIIAALLIIKTFFPDVFLQTKRWYEENILTETSVSEVTHGENDYEV